MHDHQEILPLLRFHLHLACWFNRIIPTPRVAQRSDRCSARGLVALGLHPTGVPANH